MRTKRGNRDLRPIQFQKGFLKEPEGSCFVKQGDTWVLCAASVLEGVPGFLQGTGRGWITAEYNMLPRAVSERKARGVGGREKEIGRIIARALRAAVDLSAIDGYTIIVDCDVIQADGSTRTASINGGFVALAEAFKRLREAGVISRDPVREVIGSVAVAWSGEEVLLDPDYEEDFSAKADAHFTFSESGKLVELGFSGEEGPVPLEVYEEMFEVAREGAGRVIQLIKEVL